MDRLSRQAWRSLPEPRKEERGDIRDTVPDNTSRTDDTSRTDGTSRPDDTLRPDDTSRPDDALRPDDARCYGIQHAQRTNCHTSIMDS